MKMDINSQIIDQGNNFGACLVGIANFEPLLNSPSHTLFGKLDRQKIVGLKNSGKAIPEDIGCLLQNLSTDMTDFNPCKKKVWT